MNSTLKVTESSTDGLIKIKLFSGSGTRHWPRYRISDIPRIRKVVTNADSAVTIANISRGGALLQTMRPLMDRTRIRLKVVTADDIIPLSCFILRSSVAIFNGKLRFQSAVAFDQPLEIVADLPQSGGTRHEDPSHNEEPDMMEAFLAIQFGTEPDAEFEKMTALNDW